VRIGFAGNTNNYPFRLARALRALGHEVVFFVDRPSSEPRHRPEFHYADVRYPYPTWIHEVPPLTDLRTVPVFGWATRRVLRVLETCDGVVLNGEALSLGSLLHRPTIGLLTGSDLDVYADPRSVAALAAVPGRFSWIPGIYFLKRMLFSRLVRLQRAGIAKCRLLDYAVPGLLPDSDALLDDLGVETRKRASFMLTDIESLPPPRNARNGVLRIFCATRLQWHRSATGANISPLDAKGTDTMLEGLRMFLERAHRRVQIDMIRVGTNVPETVRHVAKLGLDAHVRWHEELTQAEFLEEMSRADVVLENFGGEGGIGMAARDAIAMGMPVIAWGKSYVFERTLGAPLPIYEARTPDGICARLNEIVDDPAGVSRNAARARAFAARWFSARCAAGRCVAVFEEALREGSSP
jgi:glycosyltransferase involved in cell wall biosynthesis